MKPFFESLHASEAGSIRGAGLIWEEKIDGKFTELAADGAHMVGESRPGEFWAFDCLKADGQDLRAMSLAARRVALLEVVSRVQKNNPSFQDVKILLPEIGYGPEFLNEVLQRGGEGVVVKDLGQSWPARWLKIKRSCVYYCRVAGLDEWSGGVMLTDRETGQTRGKMPLRGGKFDRVRVGSVLKVEAYGLTAKGLLREARPCRDTETSWLVSY